ncbi:MAG: hypothetical protein ACLVJH_18850 [Faecalibacterium prausnitzii]
MTVGTPDATTPGPVCGGERRSRPSGRRALAGSFPAVVFDPGHLSLVKGAPEGRRRISGRCAVPAVPRVPGHLPPLCAGFATEKCAAASLRKRHGTPRTRKSAPCWKC